MSRRLDCLISLFYIKPQPSRRVTLATNDCLISLFYIKPQPAERNSETRAHCLISLFYIKPQPLAVWHVRVGNCLISLFYIKPQPCALSSFRSKNCLISLFYIKPQLTWFNLNIQFIVLYLFSTSNHNLKRKIAALSELSYISFLHQTTTGCHTSGSRGRLSYISFLHQTTTGWLSQSRSRNCLISLFYIKPQPLLRARYTRCIVLYLFSTSNHNRSRVIRTPLLIVLYLFSTSNHNMSDISLQTSALSYISFLHQTTTIFS